MLLTKPSGSVVRRALLCAVAINGSATLAFGEVPSGDWAVYPPGKEYVNTTELAAPNAQEVILDLPNAFHWSLHQRGELGPWIYVFYPDGSAKIMNNSERPQVRVLMKCEAGVACRGHKVNGPDFEVPVGLGERPSIPESTDLDAVTRYVAQWLLAGTAPPPPPPPEPKPEPEAAEIAQPIASATTPELSEGGEDPDLLDASDVVANADGAAPGDALPAPQPEQSPPEEYPVCAEEEPFIHTTCVEPTEPIRQTATPTPRPAQSPTGNADAAPINAASAARPAEEEKETLFDRYKVNCSVTSSASLGFLHPDPDKRGVAKPRASLGCSAAITDRLSVRFSVIGYMLPHQKEAWDPDYTYAFSYRVNDKITLGYSNYSARFSGGGSPVAGLLNGSLRGSYKLPPIRLPNNKTIPCTASLGLPDPTAKSMNLSCGYAVTKKLRISASAYAYMPGQQDTYQPDYSYTASYRFNDDWQLSYNNYSNNRFPWNKGSAPGPGLTGGSLSLTFKFKF